MERMIGCIAEDDGGGGWGCGKPNARQQRTYRGKVATVAVALPGA
jgi:hypothetical protein